MSDPTRVQITPPAAPADDTGPVTPGAGGTEVQTPDAARLSADSSAQPPAFDAPGYDILGELGRGGMGVVYRARCRATDEVVALKTLQRMTPADLYRFKREFRVLAGLSHPNLIALRELVSDGVTWFFTMELLDGTHLLAHTSEDATPQEGSSPGGSRVKVRELLRQLAAGVAALHAAGVLHRDIKPANVLVTPAGRVVLLDFGLAGELASTGEYQSAPGHVCGTIGYMAPEQAAGEPVSPAADWYSVGVVLYQVLAGRLPYTGPALNVLRDKQNFDPPPPPAVRPGVPPDLERLCMDLLCRDPGRRPGGADVLRRLAGSPGPADERAARPAAQPERRLVGRGDHLRALGEAFAAVRRGRAACVRVHGPSGAGKTALVRYFLDRAAADGAVTLAGRCYEQELVPYKAFDGVADALSQYLAGLPAEEVSPVLPRDVGALVRLFPVLGRVPAVAGGPRAGGEVPDQREVRRRGTAALRELLARFGDRRPLVVFIDDLQWGDTDSGGLLEELLRPPDPPAVLMLLCHRSEDAASPLLQPVLQIRPAAPWLDVRDVPVGELSAEDARALAVHLMGTDDAPARARAEAIAREAAGNPFYVGELAEAARAGLAVDGNVALDRLLWDRTRGLPAAAVRLLDAAAVAGRPVRLDVARHAAGGDAGFHAAQMLLRSRRLLRGTGLADGDRIAPYHDRVREAVLAHLPPDERCEYHLRLARAAEAVGDHDPEFLAVHYHGAGDGRTAGRHYATAAAEAAAATAFDQAARLYRLALEAGEWPAEGAAELWAGLASALANAGRGVDAAEAYLEAASRTRTDQAIEWRRRAAEQYLISGHIDTGLDVLRQVVADVGLTMPERPLWTLLRLAAGRVRLMLRGILFRPRSAGELSAARLRRIDVCWSAAIGLSLTDYVRGAYFQTRGLLLALRAGEPGRIARSLAIEGGHAATSGPVGGQRSLRLLEAAGTLAAQSSDPHPRAVTTLARGMREYLAGRYRAAAPLFEAAEQSLRDNCTGTTWELDTARTWWCWCHCYLGEWEELSARWPTILTDAWNRGDIYAAGEPEYLHYGDGAAGGGRTGPRLGRTSGSNVPLVSARLSHPAAQRTDRNHSGSPVRRDRLCGLEFPSWKGEVVPPIADLADSAVSHRFSPTPGESRPHGGGQPSFLP